MSKRERSPEATDPAGRPSKRAASEHILETTNSSGGLTINDSFGGNSVAGGTQGFGVAGPGPSTSALMDEDVPMEEDMAGVSPLHEGPSFAQLQISNPAQLYPSQRPLSLPNPSRHPYGHQHRLRNADGSPLINVVPATPADSQHSLPMPTNHGIEHHPNPALNHMLQAPLVPRGSPPPSDPTGMRPQDLSLSTQQQAGKNKRVAFGPRLDCEKCRQGEIHFAHVHYE